MPLNVCYYVFALVMLICGSTFKFLVYKEETKQCGKCLFFISVWVIGT